VSHVIIIAKHKDSKVLFLLISYHSTFQKIYAYFNTFKTA